MAPSKARSPVRSVRSLRRRCAGAAHPRLLRSFLGLLRQVRSSERQSHQDLGAVAVAVPLCLFQCLFFVTVWLPRSPSCSLVASHPSTALYVSWLLLVCLSLMPLPLQVVTSCRHQAPHAWRHYIRGRKSWDRNVQRATCDFGHQRGEIRKGFGKGQVVPETKSGVH